MIWLLELRARYHRWRANVAKESLDSVLSVEHSARASKLNTRIHNLKFPELKNHREEGTL